MTADLDRQRPKTGGVKSASRADLQGMRAVAVLAVFSDHLFGWPSGGFVGVDVFFVLSGFFITGLLIRERTNTRKLSFRDFYIRRVKRILPSAMLVLVVTVIGAYVLFPALRAKQTLLDALYAALFAANIRFEALGADYFQQDQPPSPIQHYWSLSIEEQFYFVWPALLVLIFAMTRGWRRRGNSWRHQVGLFGAMAVIVGASFTWAMIQSATDPNSAYFSTFTRVWELGVGALVAIAGPWIARIPDAIRPVLAYLGLAGVAASLFLITSSVQFPAPWAALPVLSTALVIVSFHGAEVRWMFPLTNPVARVFGDTSYTLYLWHWPVIILLQAVLPESMTFYVLAVVLALGLTGVTYYFYEDPIRKSNWLTDDRSETAWRQKAWAFAGGTVAAVVVVSIAGFHFTDKISAAAAETTGVVDEVAPPPMVAPAKVTANTIVPIATPLPGNDPCYGAPAIVNPSCPLRNPDVPLTPSIDTFSTDSGTPTCWTDKGEELKSCTYGYSGDDAVRIALVGDSHSTGTLVALAPYLTALKWRLDTYIGWGCAWENPAQEACSTAMPQIQEALLAQPYALVITTASRSWGTINHYVNAWTPVAAAGSRIAVIADNPGVNKDALACLTRVTFGADNTGECGMNRAKALAKRDPLISAAAEVPAATVIDLTQYFCTADLCPSVIGNVIVYSDVGAHLTASYLKTLAPAVVDGIRGVLAPQ